MTPVRRQYLRIKRRFPDAVVLFRLGDFYETFDDDARLASKELDIVLTSRSMGKNLKVPMAGIPAHALETYLARLVKRGYKVAICEQLSDPSDSRGLVERDVVRVVTPGTVVEPSLLDQKANNYLAAVLLEGDYAGLSYVDISTGEYFAAQLPCPEVSLELERLSPAEVLAPEGQEQSSGPVDWVVTTQPPEVFEPERAGELLLDHFKVATLESFGCAHLPLAVGAAGAILEYLAQTQRSTLVEVETLRTYSTSRYMTLDHQTRRNLELFQEDRPSGSGPSLCSTLDLTRTPMGGRLLRRWLGQPLLDVGEITWRQDAVELFYSTLPVRDETRTLLSGIGDMERVVHRVRMGVAAPRELVALKAGLEVASDLMAVTERRDGPAVSWWWKGIQHCEDVVALIGAAIAPEPQGDPGEGGVIVDGFAPELDELRLASYNAREYIAGLELRERERSGVKSLKVGYNRVFGYYIEVSNPNLSQVPSDYMRRQTLVGGERFITPELKEYESLVLNAKERIEELERTVYRQVCAQIGERVQAIGQLAGAVAHTDVFASLGEVAFRYGYVRPHLIEGDDIEIKGGRHPVVERAMPSGSFVPNDVHLSTTDAQLVVLTGPNMAGKSTYIRQVALIVLMAQVGGFVPAESATLGLVDRIFTRVGLQDDLTTGKSTFMVEMLETASILNQATPRSLVILDEIGRGTSTYDGLSIAQSVAEYIHNSHRLGCKTLFATHYHELTRLADVLPRVKNYNVAVSEEGGEVVFLHRIVPGSADRSYGIQVAQLAGLPKTVIVRAWEVLREMEDDGSLRRTGPGARRGRREAPIQMPLFGGASTAMEELMKLDVSNMTPIEAINALYDLQRKSTDAAGEADTARRLEKGE